MDQFKDIYNDENVISSDEYDETDDDDLMNAAVSSATPKLENNEVNIPPKVSSIGEKIGRTLDEKKKKKQMQKLSLKLKRKSISWMRNKFRRNKARNSYLVNLARAKSLIRKQPIVQQSNVEHVEQKTDLEMYQTNEQNTNINIKETLPIAPEPHAPISTSSQKPQIEHETIDLDDTDEDDFDEDDDSISSSGEYDDQNNDDDDDDIDDDSQEDDDNEEAGNVIQEFREDDKKDIENLMTTIENKENGLQEEQHEEKLQETIMETTNNMPIINNDNNENEPEVTNFIVQETKQQEEEEASTVIIHPNATEMQPKLNTPPLIEMHHVPTINAGTIESGLSHNNNNHYNKNNEHLNDISSITNKDIEMTDITQDLGIEQSFFFNEELNVMYPTFDRIINEHVTFPETAEMLKRKVEFITADIDIIKKAREKAEQECNRLIFAQHAKEQILARVMRKIKHLEVNTEPLDASEIEKSAMRFIGQVPKETPQPIRQPPPKKRKLEPKTVDELIAYRAAMSIDAINREKAQFDINTNSFLDTMKSFENSPISKDFAFRSKRDINRRNYQYFDANVTMEPKKSNFENNSQWKDPSFNDILESSHIKRSRNFTHSSNILNFDGRHNDSIPYGLDNVSHSSALSNILNKSSQPSKKVINLNGEAYEIVIERKVPNKTPQLFPVLNQSNFNDETEPKRDETLIVHLDASDFEDKPHRKFRGDPNGNYTCQHCGKHEAQFVCADCENQWYCSRTCQVSAWDAHSDFCE